eukprot:TRINITY_DN21524_c0_g1_i1.p1 TRINITY_DN21524_c0_g1~~TRINITY_DN21524_c0_g1_i1.p1  ORF type:complete len:449 (-),score=85.83 TRINITY_DN21524_c0_g1_i1:552-1898(-)
MLRWGGDYSLPRFRAKLAEKNQLHPSVEPEYCEVYRPELGERIIVRREYGSGSGHVMATSSSAGSLGASSGYDPYSYSSSTASATRGQAGSRRGSATFSNLQKSGSTGTLPRLTREISAPQLGLRRMEVAPASLSRGRRVAQPPAVSAAATSAPSSPMSPTSDSGKHNPAALEKEKAASKQLWMAVSGSEVYFKEQVMQMKRDIAQGTVPQPLSKMPVPGGMKLAMKEGANLDWRNEEWDGATLLLKGIRSGALELVMWLLSVGADHTATDNSGRGLLHWAAVEGSAGMTEYLLQNVPEISPVGADGGGDHPIHLAAAHGSLPVVRFLVRAQADPLTQNGGGFTPVELALSRRHWHVSRYLKEFRQHEEDKKHTDFQVPKSFMRPCDTWRCNELKELALDPFDPKPVIGPEADMLDGVRREVQSKLHATAKKYATPPEWAARKAAETG